MSIEQLTADYKADLAEASGLDVDQITIQSVDQTDANTFTIRSTLEFYQKDEAATTTLLTKMQDKSAFTRLAQTFGSVVSVPVASVKTYAPESDKPRVYRVTQNAQGEVTERLETLRRRTGTLRERVFNPQNESDVLETTEVGLEDEQGHYTRNTFRKNGTRTIVKKKKTDEALVETTEVTAPDANNRVVAVTQQHESGTRVEVIKDADNDAIVYLQTEYSAPDPTTGLIVTTITDVVNGTVVVQKQDADGNVILDVLQKLVLGGVTYERLNLASTSALYYDATTYANTTLRDESGNGRDLMAYGSPVMDPSSQSVTFDGQNDYFHIDSIGNSAGAWSHTFAFWMYPDGTFMNSAEGTQQHVFTVGTPNNMQWITFKYIKKNNQALVHTNHFWKDYAMPLQGTDFFDRWHHIVITYDGPTNTLRTYDNGVSVDLTITAYPNYGTTEASVLNMNANSPMDIGRDSRNQRYFKGKLRQFQMFHKALSETEIAELPLLDFTSTFDMLPRYTGNRAGSYLHPDTQEKMDLLFRQNTDRQLVSVTLPENDKHGVHLLPGNEISLTTTRSLSIPKTPFAISLWFQIDDTNASVGGGFLGGMPHLMPYLITQGFIRGYASTDPRAYGDTLNTYDQPLVKGRWYHIVRTWEPIAVFGTGDMQYAWKQRYYLDGVQIYDVNYPPDRLYPSRYWDERNDTSARTASDPWDFDLYFNYDSTYARQIPPTNGYNPMQISNVAVWMNHPMTRNDVGLLHHAGYDHPSDQSRPDARFVNTGDAKLYYDALTLSDPVTLDARPAWRDDTSNSLEMWLYGTRAYDSETQSLVFNGTDSRGWVRGTTYFGNSSTNKETYYQNLQNAAGAWTHTVAFWIWVDPEGPGGTVLHIGNTGTTTNQSLTFTYIRQADKTLHWVYDFGNNAMYGQTPSTAHPSNRWMHVVLTYDASTNTRSVYLEGVLSATQSTGSALNLPANTEMTVGAHLDAVNFFQGKLRMVQVWERVLRPIEIAEHHDTDFQFRARLRKYKLWRIRFSIAETQHTLFDVSPNYADASVGRRHGLFNYEGDDLLANHNPDTNYTSLYTKISNRYALYDASDVLIPRFDAGNIHSSWLKAGSSRVSWTNIVQNSYILIGFEDGLSGDEIHRIGLVSYINGRGGRIPKEMKLEFYTGELESGSHDSTRWVTWSTLSHQMVTPIPNSPQWINIDANTNLHSIADIDIANKTPVRPRGNLAPATYRYKFQSRVGSARSEGATVWSYLGDIKMNLIKANGNVLNTWDRFVSLISRTVPLNGSIATLLGDTGATVEWAKFGQGTNGNMLEIVTTERVDYFETVSDPFRTPGYNIWENNVLVFSQNQNGWGQSSGSNYIYRLHPSLIYKQAAHLYPLNQRTGLKDVRGNNHLIPFVMNEGRSTFYTLNDLPTTVAKFPDPHAASVTIPALLDELDRPFATDVIVRTDTRVVTNTGMSYATPLNLHALDWSDRVLIQTLNQPSDYPTYVYGTVCATNADGSVVVVGGSAFVVLWKYVQNTYTVSHVFDVLKVNDVAVSYNGRVFAVSYSIDATSGHLQVYMEEEGNTWTTHDLPMSGVYGRYGQSVSISAHGLRVAVGGHYDVNGGCMFVWDYDPVTRSWTSTDLSLTSGTNGQYGLVLSLSADGNTLVTMASNMTGGVAYGSTSGTGTLYIWQYETSLRKWGKPTLTGFVTDIPYSIYISGIRGNPYSVDLAGDGYTLVIGCFQNKSTGVYGGEVQVWRYHATTYEWGTYSANNTSFTAGTPYKWVAHLSPYTRYGTRVTISYDGDMVVICGTHDTTRGTMRLYQYDRTLGHWGWYQDLEKNFQSQNWSGVDMSVQNLGLTYGSTVCISRDGTRVFVGASGTGNGKVYAYRTYRVGNLTRSLVYDAYVPLPEPPTVPPEITYRYVFEIQAPSVQATTQTTAYSRIQQITANGQALEDIDGFLSILALIPPDDASVETLQKEADSVGWLGARVNQPGTRLLELVFTDRVNTFEIRFPSPDHAPGWNLYENDVLMYSENAHRGAETSPSPVSYAYEMIANWEGVVRVREVDWSAASDTPTYDLSMTGLNTDFQYGKSCALNLQGTMAVVGAQAVTGGGVYVWKYASDTDTWTLSHQVESNTIANYGWAVDISANGRVFAVGGHTDQSSGTGHVYMYDGTVWKNYDVSMSGVDGQYGISCALSSDGLRVVFSAWKNPRANGGGAFVWDYDTESDTWGHYELTGFVAGVPYDLSHATQYAYGNQCHISADGNTVTVASTSGEIQSSHAYVWQYNRSTHQWGRFTPTGFVSGTAHALFGNASLTRVSHDGTVVLVTGGTMNASGSWIYEGKAYVWTWNASTNEWGKYTTTGFEAGTPYTWTKPEYYFGNQTTHLSLDGRRAFIGWKHKLQIYQYDESTYTWIQTKEFDRSSVSSTHTFPISATLSGDASLMMVGETIIVRNGSGRVYIWRAPYTADETVVRTLAYDTYPAEPIVLNSALLILRKAERNFHADTQVWSDTGFNHHDLVASGTPVVDADGALVFDGVDDCLGIANLKNGVGAWSHTVVFSVYVPATTGANPRTIFVLGEATPGKHTSVYTRVENDRVLWGWDFGDNAVVTDASTTTDLPDRWYDVVLVYEGATNTRHLYVEGTELSVQPSGSVYGAPLDMRGGRGLTLGANLARDVFFQGRVRDFRIYDGAMSSANVATLFMDLSLRGEGYFTVGETRTNVVYRTDAWARVTHVRIPQQTYPVVLAELRDATDDRVVARSLHVLTDGGVGGYTYEFEIAIPSTGQAAPWESVAPYALEAKDADDQVVPIQSIRALTPPDYTQIAGRQDITKVLSTTGYVMWTQAKNVVNTRLFAIVTLTRASAFEMRHTRPYTRPGYRVYENGALIYTDTMSGGSASEPVAPLTTYRGWVSEETTERAWVLLNRDVPNVQLKPSYAGIRNVGSAEDAQAFDRSYSRLGDLFLQQGSMTPETVFDTAKRYEFRWIPYLATDTKRLDPNDAEPSRYIGWTQDSDPTRTIAVVNLRGETHVGLTEAATESFGGLKRTQTDYTNAWLHAGINNNWWYALASSALNSGGIPFAYNTTYATAQKTELWVRAFRTETVPVSTGDVRVKRVEGPGHVAYEHNKAIVFVAPGVTDPSAEVVARFEHAWRLDRGYRFELTCGATPTALLYKSMGFFLGDARVTFRTYAATTYRNLRLHVLNNHGNTTYSAASEFRIPGMRVSSISCSVAPYGQYAIANLVDGSTSNYWQTSQALTYTVDITYTGDLPKVFTATFTNSWNNQGWKDVDVYVSDDKVNWRLIHQARGLVYGGGTTDTIPRTNRLLLSMAGVSPRVADGWSHVDPVVSDAYVPRYWTITPVQRHGQPDLRLEAFGDAARRVSVMHGLLSEVCDDSTTNIGRMIQSASALEFGLFAKAQEDTAPEWVALANFTEDLVGPTKPPVVSHYRYVFEINAPCWHALQYSTGFMPIRGIRANGNDLMGWSAFVSARPLNNFFRGGDRDFYSILYFNTTGTTWMGHGVKTAGVRVFEVVFTERITQFEMNADRPYYTPGWNIYENEVLVLSESTNRGTAADPQPVKYTYTLSSTPLGGRTDLLTGAYRDGSKIVPVSYTPDRTRVFHNQTYPVNIPALLPADGEMRTTHTIEVSVANGQFVFTPAITSFALGERYVFDNSAQATTHPLAIHNRPVFEPTSSWMDLFELTPDGVNSYTAETTRADLTNVRVLLTQDKTRLALRNTTGWTYTKCRRPLEMKVGNVYTFEFYMDQPGTLKRYGGLVFGHQFPMDKAVHTNPKVAAINMNFKLYPNDASWDHWHHGRYAVVWRDASNNPSPTSNDPVTGGTGSALTSPLARYWKLIVVRRADQNDQLDLRIEGYTDVQRTALLYWAYVSEIGQHATNDIQYLQHDTVHIGITHGTSVGTNEYTVLEHLVAHHPEKSEVTYAHMQATDGTLTLDYDDLVNEDALFVHCTTHPNMGVTLHGDAGLSVSRPHALYTSSTGYSTETYYTYVFEVRIPANNSLNGLVNWLKLGANANELATWDKFVSVREFIPADHGTETLRDIKNILARSGSGTNTYISWSNRVIGDRLVELVTTEKVTQFEIIHNRPMYAAGYNIYENGRLVYRDTVNRTNNLLPENPMTGDFYTLSPTELPKEEGLVSATVEATNATSVRGAYSVRRLFSAYDGPQVRVMRSTDNLELDVCFDRNGVNAEYATWIGSATATVTRWYDQSGKGHHGTPTGTVTLDYATGGVVFSSATRATVDLPDGSMPYGDEAYTILVHHGANTASTNSGTKAGFIGFGTHTNNNAISIRTDNGTSYQNYWYYNDQTRGVLRPNQVVVARYDGTMRNLYVPADGFGEEIQATPRASKPIYNAIGRTTGGANGASSSEFWNGAIHTVIVYDRAVSYDHIAHIAARLTPERDFFPTTVRDRAIPLSTLDVNSRTDRVTYTEDRKHVVLVPGKQPTNNSTLQATVRFQQMLENVEGHVYEFEWHSTGEIVRQDFQLLFGHADGDVENMNTGIKLRFRNYADTSIVQFYTWHNVVGAWKDGTTGESILHGTTPTSPEWGSTQNSAFTYGKFLPAYWRMTFTTYNNRPDALMECFTDEARTFRLMYGYLSEVSQGGDFDRDFASHTHLPLSLQGYAYVHATPTTGYRPEYVTFGNLVHIPPPVIDPPPPPDVFFDFETNTRDTSVDLYEFVPHGTVGTMTLTGDGLAFTEGGQAEADLGNDFFDPHGSLTLQFDYSTTQPSGDRMVLSTWSNEGSGGYTPTGFYAKVYDNSLEFGAMRSNSHFTDVYHKFSVDMSVLGGAFSFFNINTFTFVFTNTRNHTEGDKINIRIYVNGVLRGSSDIADNFLTQADRDAGVFYGDDSHKLYLNRWMHIRMSTCTFDNLKIVRRALSDAEVRFPFLFGSGWTLVRSLPGDSTSWYEGNGLLDGYHGGEFLFTRGDLSMWLIADHEQVNGDYYTTAEPRTATRSVYNDAPFQVEWLNESTNPDHPSIGVFPTYASSTSIANGILYQENGATTYLNSIHSSGMRVYTRGGEWTLDKHLAFHYGAFDNAYGEENVTEAARNFHVYEDTPLGTYSWGSLTAVSTTNNQTEYQWTPPTSITTDVLLVAGGGCGGPGHHGGGGGAGGSMYHRNVRIESELRTIRVGSGGTTDKNATDSLSVFTNGYNTSFTDLTESIGGGKGGSETSKDTNVGKDGGSGSGAGAYAGSLGGNGIAGQGNRGGAATTGRIPGGGNIGGGGGGSKSVGADELNGGHGGDGFDYYSVFGDYGDRGRFAGGGGGGALDTDGSNRQPGTGGRGGGGTGGKMTTYDGTTGKPHTGGGGGGEGKSGSRHPGAGGSGIVLIKSTRPTIIPPREELQPSTFSWTSTTENGRTKMMPVTSDLYHYYTYGPVGQTPYYNTAWMIKGDITDSFTYYSQLDSYGAQVPSNNLQLTFRLPTYVYFAIRDASWNEENVTDITTIMQQWFGNQLGEIQQDLTHTKGQWYISNDRGLGEINWLYALVQPGDYNFDIYKPTILVSTSCFLCIGKSVTSQVYKYTFEMNTSTATGGAPMFSQLYADENDLSSWDAFQYVEVITPPNRADQPQSANIYNLFDNNLNTHTAWWNDVPPQGTQLFHLYFNRKIRTFRLVAYRPLYVPGWNIYENNVLVYSGSHPGSSTTPINATYTYTLNA